MIEDEERAARLRKHVAEESTIDRDEHARLVSKVVGTAKRAEAARRTVTVMARDILRDLDPRRGAR